MPMVRAMRLLNAVEAGTTSGAQLQALLSDPGRLGEWSVLMGMRGQTRRMAASSTAMTAVAASSTAMTAVAASLTAMTAVAASLTAMTAVAASKTALLACWNSAIALDALRGTTVALNTLLNSPFKSSINHGPILYTGVMVPGKTILLQSRNDSGSDTNYLRSQYSNGTISGSGDYVYSTSTSFSPQMLAFQDIRHYSQLYAYTWRGDAVKVD